MCFNQTFYIIKAQSETFNIVEVTCMNPEHFPENVFLVFNIYSYAFILNCNNNMIVTVKSAQCYIRLFGRVLVCIIQQVGDHIFDMHSISIHPVVFSIEVQFYCSVSFFNQELVIP